MDRQDRDFTGPRQRGAAPRRRLTEAGLEPYLKEMVLLPGESFVWQGRPWANEALRSQSKNLLFGTLVMAFCTVFFLTAERFEWSLLVPLAIFGIGLWTFVKAWRVRGRARHSYYAVTNKRVLIAVLDGAGARVTTITPEQIVKFELNDFGDGRGNVELRETISSGKNGPVASVEFDDALWGVSDFAGAAKAVQALLAARDGSA
jgi:hypothetical protein